MNACPTISPTFVVIRGFLFFFLFGMTPSIYGHVILQEYNTTDKLLPIEKKAPNSVDMLSKHIPVATACKYAKL